MTIQDAFLGMEPKVIVQANYPAIEKISFFGWYSDREGYVDLVNGFTVAVFKITPKPKP